MEIKDGTIFRAWVCECVFLLCMNVCADVEEINKYLIFVKNGMLLAVRLIVKWELVAIESIEVVYEKPESITINLP